MNSWRPSAEITFSQFLDCQEESMQKQSTFLSFSTIVPCIDVLRNQYWAGEYFEKLLIIVLIIHKLSLFYSLDFLTSAHISTVQYYQILLLFFIEPGLEDTSGLKSMKNFNFKHFSVSQL